MHTKQPYFNSAPKKSINFERSINHSPAFRFARHACI
jgi:hypothetical protein